MNIDKRNYMQLKTANRINSNLVSPLYLRLKPTLKSSNRLFEVISRHKVGNCDVVEGEYISDARPPHRRTRGRQQELPRKLESLRFDSIDTKMRLQIRGMDLIYFDAKRKGDCNR